MIVYKSPCPDCTASCESTVRQSFDSKDLMWSTSFRCTTCGTAIEADNVGFPSEEIRKAFMAEHGTWGLLVELAGSDQVSICKILHCDLDTDFADVHAMKKRIPGIVYAGTQEEMLWLQSRLFKFGYAARVVHLESDCIPPGTELPIQSNRQ